MKFALALVASLAHAVKVDDLMDDLEDAVSVTLYDDMTWSVEDNCEWWNWEDCSQMWWRNACEWEREGDCGWIYEDYYTWETFWVSCDEFNSWDSCNGDDYWEDEYCWNEWNWEDCSQMWWRYGCDWELEGDGWGWIYEAWNDDSWTWDTFWVSGDEFSTWDSCNGDYWVDEYCYNEWNWEDCSQMWWRNACEWEAEGDCGWIYEDYYTWETFWVSCDEFNSWDSCNGDDYNTWVDEYCYNEWTWEDCSQMWYRDACEWEIEGDGYGWIYEVYNYDTWTYDSFWVSGEEFESWEYCW